jgi:hypothetical protein
MTIYAYNTTLSNGCGVGQYFEFRNEQCRYGDAHDISEVPNPGGAGYLVVHFIVKDEKCDEAYKILKKRFPIVFESEKRENVNSGNKVYFCVYDTKGKCKSGYDAVTDYEMRDNDD